MLTQRRLMEVLTYNPETGVFTWKKGARRGKVAGTRHDERGFLKVSIDNERHLLHRLAWLWMKGTSNRWSVVHRNGDHSDNRWSNLRDGDRGQKKQYRPPGREPTNILGVSQVGDRFEAMIDHQGKVFNLGSFISAEEARVAIAVTFERARARQVKGRRSAISA